MDNRGQLPNGSVLEGWYPDRDVGDDARRGSVGLEFDEDRHNCVYHC